MLNSEIDVSKCAFYNNGKCNNPNGMACNCCNNAYCYYKELQQAIKDRDYYKQIIDGWFLGEQLQPLKQENEQLKAKIQEYVEDRFCQGGCAIYQFDKIEELKQENEELRNLHINLVGVKECEIKELIKYKQCLDEIERICKECHKHDYDLCCTCKYADNCRAENEYTSYDVANYIHSIIKQAKEGE